MGIGTPSNHSNRDRIVGFLCSSAVVRQGRRETSAYCAAARPTSRRTPHKTRRATTTRRPHSAWDAQILLVVKLLPAPSRWPRLPRFGCCDSLGDPLLRVRGRKTRPRCNELREIGPVAFLDRSPCTSALVTMPPASRRNVSGVRAGL